MQVLLVDNAACDENSPVRGENTSLTQAEGSKDALSLMRLYLFDVIVVETTRLFEDGFKFIRELREVKNDTPIIAFVRSEGNDRMRAFNLGADDVVVKPIQRDELHARMRAIVRRLAGHSPTRIHVGDLQIFADGRITFKNRPLHVTRAEFRILELLVLRAGRIVTREALVEVLYANEAEPESPRIIDVFVCNLRRRLRAVGSDGLIETVRSKGLIIKRTQP